MKDRSLEVRRRAAHIAAEDPYRALGAGSNASPGAAHLERFKSKMDEAGITDLLTQYPLIRSRMDNEGVEMCYGQIGYKVSFDRRIGRLCGQTMQPRRGWVRTRAYLDDMLMDEIVEHLAHMVAAIDGPTPQA